MTTPQLFIVRVLVLLALSSSGHNLARAEEPLFSPAVVEEVGSRHMSGTLEGGQPAQFRLPLRQGQTLSILCHARKSSVGVFVKDPEGDMLASADHNCAHKSWSVAAAKTGTYTIGVLQHHATALKGQSAFYKMRLSAH